MVFIFDIGNVLIDFDLPRLLDKISRHTHLSLEELYKTWSPEDTRALESGAVDSKRHFEEYAKRIGLKWTYDDWKRAWVDIYAFNSRGMKLFDDLKKRGFPVYLLSNLAEYNRDAILMKFEDFFTRSNGNFLSFELGMVKPDPEIYLHVCARIGAPPGKCVFIDDIHENILGARDAGLEVILFSEDDMDRVTEAVQLFSTPRDRHPC